MPLLSEADSNGYNDTYSNSVTASQEGEYLCPGLKNTENMTEVD
jgi:hypothetical protein